MIDIVFYVNTSDKNACRPNLIDDVTYSGTLRPDAEQSVRTPSILIEVDPGDTTLFTKNYCYIEAFGRYYHINDIKSIRNTLIRLDLVSDPLASFFEEFGAQDALIERAETFYNLLLKDGKLPVECETEYDKYVAVSTPFSTSSIIGVCTGTNGGSISGLTISDEFVADGTSNRYYLSQEYIPGTVSVTVNGTPSTTWLLVGGGTGSYVKFDNVLTSGDVVVITYRTP